MLVVEPIFTLVALNHEAFDVLEGMRFLTVAIAVEIVVIVIVFLIFIIYFLIEQLAGQWHPSIAAIASKI